MKQELDVWALIQNNEFEKACEKADEDYEVDSNSIWNLRNKVYALFHLKKYYDVISLSEKLIEYRKGETDVDFLNLGIANWIIGNSSKAIEAWQLAQNSLYKDATGGIETQVFLYFAGVKTGLEKLKLTAIKTLKKLLKSKRSLNFPGPIGHYLINDIDENDLISSIINVPILKERQLSQVYFVLAVKKLEAGDTEGYYHRLKQSISFGSASYLEQMYYIAKGELELKK